jgi:hypothetical protein
MIGLVLILMTAEPEPEGIDVDDAMRAAVRAGPQAGRLRMEQWIAEHPASPDVDRARFWQANSWADARAYAEADRILADLEARDSPLKWDAALLRADLELQQQRFGLAEERYREVQAPEGSRWAYEARERADVARWGGRRREAMWCLLGLLLALCVARAVLARRVLWPLPEEAVWTAPIFLLIAVAALPRDSVERAGVLAAAFAGFTLLWVNGAYLKSRPLSPPRRIMEAWLGLAQVAAALYCAIVASGLWESVANTFAAGPE